MSDRLTREPPFDPGTFVLLTKPNCPACEAFKKQEEVQTAIENGAAVELQPDDDLYDHIREAAGVEVLPGVVEWTGAAFVEVA